MKKFFLFGLLCVVVSSFAQEEVVVTEQGVTRIIKTLSADAMMGRPAARPELIEPAAAFIENEFKRIGLAPFSGLRGYRQEFSRQRIAPLSATVKIDGNIVGVNDYLIISEKTDIDASGLPIFRITSEAANGDARQFFFSSAFRQLRDTTSGCVLIDESFRDAFKEFGQYMRQRFASGRKGLKVFVIGNYEGKSASVKGRQEVVDVVMSNIVGVVPGKSRPDEFVIFSAHYDHIGIQPTVDGDSIANGADDDASGTTAVILLAEHFKRVNNNERSLIFVAFTAEEIGGFGSRYFSEHLDPDKVVAMFNIEMIGKPSKWGRNAAFLTGFERSNLGEIMARNLEGTGFQIKPDPYPEQNLFYRSDNATLARLGVPAHTISTDQIDSDELYHTVNDEFESLDVGNIAAAIRAIALASQSVISGVDTPSRIDKATVR